MRGILLKIRYFERGYQKASKKLTLFFLSNSVPFNERSYQKQKGSGTSDQLLFRSQNKFRKIPLFVIYYLTKFDDVKQFLSYSKNYICKFMQVSSWHHKLSHSPLSFWIWKLWKGMEKLQKFKYLKNEKSFLDESKNIFHSF